MSDTVVLFNGPRCASAAASFMKRRLSLTLLLAGQKAESRILFVFTWLAELSDNGNMRAGFVDVPTGEPAKRTLITQTAVLTGDCGNAGSSKSV